MVPLNYGACKAAADLAERGRHAAGHRPTATATLAAAVAARAYALNHQSEQARTAVAAADALMERLPAGERSDTWLTYGEQRHHVHLSHAYTTLGDTRRTRESQQRALELSAPTSIMTPGAACGAAASKRAATGSCWCRAPNPTACRPTPSAGTAWSSTPR